MMNRTSKFLRPAEIVLLLGGIVGVCAWIAGGVAPIIANDWGSWAFDRERAGQTTTPSDYILDRKDRLLGDIAAEWDVLRLRYTKSAGSVVQRIPPVGLPANGNRVNQEVPLKEQELIGRLQIPRLQLETIVREGARENTLSIAAGHVPNTALPGQAGNVGVAGHRDTLFRALSGIKDGDVIQFETLKGTYVYQVESTQIVKPSQVSVLNPGPYPELTLVTCYPFIYVGAAPDRFIVKARQIFANTTKPDLSAIAAVPDAPGKPSHTSPQAIPARFRSPEPPPSHPEPSPSESRTAKVNFSVLVDHSRQLTPGISMGITTVDPQNKLVSGWIWVMPDRRTVWIKRHPLHDPLTFYQEGKMRQLILTYAGSDLANGYLTMAETAKGD